MAAQGGKAAAGSEAKPTEGWSTEQPNSSQYQTSASGHHPWSSSTGTSWNYPVDNSNQHAVYYDPQRDVSVSGATQNASVGAPDVVQPAMGTTNATNTYATYLNPSQPGYSAEQYPNYYYNYPQSANEFSVQQGVDQSSGAAYQPLTSFQNSGSYVDPTSNTYYNAGTHQTAPGYATNNNYYYQNSSWAGGSSGYNQAQSYQTYTPSDANAAQSSSALPTNSFQYPQQYTQWSYYDGTSAPNSVASGTNAASAGSGYAYPSTQPPPPGTTQWKTDASAPAAPPPQAPGTPGFQSQHINQAPSTPGYQNQHINHVPSTPGYQNQHVYQAPGTSGFQNQHVNQAPGAPGFENQHVNQAPGAPGFENHYANQTAGTPRYQNQYVNQAPAYQQSSGNYRQLSLSNQAVQHKTSHAQSPSSNVYSVNHVYENSQPTMQGSATSDACRMNKIQVPTNPRIAPVFPMATPKAGKKYLEDNSSIKPAYVGVSMPKNDMKAAQNGHEGAMQGSIPVSLRTYVERNLARCKDDVQRSASQSILKEVQ